MKTKLFTLLFAIVASLGTLFADAVQIGDLYYYLDDEDKRAFVTYECNNSSSGCNYPDLTAVSIPSSVEYNSDTYVVTSIGDRAFSNCPNLISVDVPNSVTNIGQGAFSGVPNVNYTGSASGSPWGARNMNGYVEGFLVYSDASKTSLLVCAKSAQGKMTIPNSVISIGGYAFRDCIGLTSVTMGTGVDSIGDNAFYYCSGLTSVTIGNSVTSIGEYAFEACTGLTSVTIPNSVKSIGDDAFDNCSNLQNITIGSGVIYMSSPFSRCENITSIVWNAVKCSDSGNYPFYGIDKEKVTSFIFGEKVERIPEYLCEGMSNLISIILPESVTSIGAHAFDGCSSLTTITIPKNVTTIDACFSDCDKLETVIWNATNCANANKPFEGTYIRSIIFSDELESIPAYVCYGANWLNSVQLGEKVQYLNEWAFARCYALKSIEIPNTLTMIGECAFRYNHELASINIPNSVMSIGKNAFGSCDSLPVINDIQYADTYLVHATKNLSTYTIKDGTRWIGNAAFSIRNQLTSIEIPNTVEEIGSGAFNECTRLESINIPDGVVNIASGAFYNCSALKSVTIGNTVVTIGGSAFYKCTKLTSVTIGNSVEHIVVAAFEQCTSLRSIEIPNNVKSIGARAFSKCTNLSEITFGTNVENIGHYAFEGCKNMTSIYSYPIIPSILGENVFTDINKSIPLYVPAGSVEAYNAADGWKEFTNIQGIQDDATAIGLVESSAMHDESGCTKLLLGGQLLILRDGKTYTVQGQEVK